MQNFNINDAIKICSIQNHQSPAKFLCCNNSCLYNSTLICPECVLESHPQHQKECFNIIELILYAQKIGLNVFDGQINFEIEKKTIETRIDNLQKLVIQSLDKLRQELILMLQNGLYVIKNEYFGTFQKVLTGQFEDFSKEEKKKMPKILYELEVIQKQIVESQNFINQTVWQSIEFIEKPLQDLFQNFTIAYLNGDKYEGIINQGYKDGFGTMTYINGDIYQGYWKDDKREGQGQLIFQQQKCLYNGEWLNDKYHGEAILIENINELSENRYEGEWKNGLRDGKGSQAYSDSKYIGDWLEDKRQGYGKLEKLDGTIYEGEWSNDMKNGKGKQTWENGSIYEGQWKNNLREGRGVFTDEEGNKYDGEFENDLFNGEGFMIYSNEANYSGNWQNGLKHGQGFMQYSENENYDGLWQNDLKHGEGSLFLNGEIIQGVWINDQSPITCIINKRLYLLENSIFQSLAKKY